MTDAVARDVVRRMRAYLDQWSPTAGVRDLSLLVSRLSGSIDALVGEVQEEWIEELRSAWWPLEYINAVALDGGRRHLTEQEMRALSEARDEFLAILAEH